MGITTDQYQASATRCFGDIQDSPKDTPVLQHEENQLPSLGTFVFKVRSHERPVRQGGVLSQQAPPTNGPFPAKNESLNQPYPEFAFPLNRLSLNPIRPFMRKPGAEEVFLALSTSPHGRFKGGNFLGRLHCQLGGTLVVGQPIFVLL